MLKRINWYLFIIAFIYNLLDAWHTKLLLATGLIEEANPVMNYFIVNYGINSCFYIKTMVFVVLALCLLVAHNKYECKNIKVES